MTLQGIYNRDLCDELMLNQQRELHSKIELLSFDEVTIGEIQGEIINGSLNIDGSSAVRRTCSLEMIVNQTNFDITSIDNTISLNKKIKIWIGLKNSSRRFQSYGQIIWFPLGVFVLTDSNITHNVSDVTLSVSAQDKMCLLTGEVAGELQAPIELHREFVYNSSTQQYEEKEVLIYDIIQQAVSKLGGENLSKVIINDVPLEVKEPLKYVGTDIKYFDINGNEVASNSPNIVRTLNPGEFAGYRMRPFTYPKELIKNAGDSIVSILEDVKNLLGNYEYFYDVDGNFVFQEVKNYLNTSFTSITQLNNGSYIADFAKVPYIYTFKEKNIVTSFSNQPDWRNIKNDFVVWGKKNSNNDDLLATPIMYHVTIDAKPFLPPSYTKPWQQFLIEYGDNNQQDPGRYYIELKGKFSEIYDATSNTFKTDQSNFNYWFDMIDARSELGKFSVGTIGRRTKVINDENVSVLYPPEIPDIVLLPSDIAMGIINQYQAIGRKYQLVNDMSVYKSSGIQKDAFTVIRELIYMHTTFNEVINLTCLPIYTLEANHKIEVEDSRSNIYGDYVIKSMSIPLNSQDLMTINAIRVASRI